MILTIVEVPMKRQWQIHRQFHTLEDGAWWWDQTYQLLLYWSNLNESSLRPVPPPLMSQLPFHAFKAEQLNRWPRIFLALPLNS